MAGNVTGVMTQVFESMKEVTGIDLSDIVKAKGYDAQVTRNINVSTGGNKNLDGETVDTIVSLSLIHIWLWAQVWKRRPPLTRASA